MSAWADASTTDPSFYAAMPDYNINAFRDTRRKQAASAPLCVQSWQSPFQARVTSPGTQGPRHCAVPDLRGECAEGAYTGENRDVKVPRLQEQPSKAGPEPAPVERPRVADVACPSCGYENPADSRRCRKCATDL
jgi:hypothetical protein